MLKKYQIFLIVSSAAFFFTGYFTLALLSMLKISRHIFLGSDSYATEIMVCCIGALWLSTIAFVNFAIRLRVKSNGIVLSSHQKTLYVCEVSLGTIIILAFIMAFRLILYVLDFFFDWFLRNDFSPLSLVKSYFNFKFICLLIVVCPIIIMLISHSLSDLYFRVHTKTKEKKALNVFLKVMVLILAFVVIVALSLAAFSAVYYLGAIYLLSDLYPPMPV